MTKEDTEEKFKEIQNAYDHLMARFDEDDEFEENGDADGQGDSDDEVGYDDDDDDNFFYQYH